MSESFTVLVTGATGQQGGAVARLLLKRGHRVRGFTRKADSPAARQLERLGAELAIGSFDDSASIERAAEGVDAVYAMATPYEAGVEVETRQGITVVDAVKAAGVEYLLYSSVASADQNTGIPHFDSKYKIEQHIQSLDIPYTIIGPVFFFENLFSPWVSLDLQEGTLAQPLPAGRTLQQVALEDIAGFAALVLENREQFLGKRIDIASDELTFPGVAEILSTILGSKIEYTEFPLENLRAQNEDGAIMYEWFDRVGYSVDIEALRRDYPEVGWHTYEEWAKAQDWSRLEEAA
jgi:uncharacterized protein YbjT (DUF2867 family)